MWRHPLFVALVGLILVVIGGCVAYRMHAEIVVEPVDATNPVGEFAKKSLDRKDEKK